MYFIHGLLTPEAEGIDKYVHKHGLCLHLAWLLDHDHNHINIPAIKGL